MFLQQLHSHFLLQCRTDDVAPGGLTRLHPAAHGPQQALPRAPPPLLPAAGWRLRALPGVPLLLSQAAGLPLRRLPLLRPVRLPAVLSRPAGGPGPPQQLPSAQRQLPRALQPRPAAGSPVNSRGTVLCRHVGHLHIVTECSARGALLAAGCKCHFHRHKLAGEPGDCRPYVYLLY